jgi:hypothetical protein
VYRECHEFNGEQLQCCGAQHLSGASAHIFELVRVLCQPRPEPIARKRKSAAAAPVPGMSKTSGKWGHGRKLSLSETQTSAQELALVKPIKRSNKFAAKSSRLSPAENASVAGVKVASKKASSTSTGGSGMT